MAAAAIPVAEIGLAAGSALAPEILAAGASGAGAVLSGIGTIGSVGYGGYKGGKYAVHHGRKLANHYFAPKHHKDTEPEPSAVPFSPQ